jgi:hypothetical protein
MTSSQLAIALAPLYIAAFAGYLPFWIWSLHYIARMETKP